MSRLIVLAPGLSGYNGWDPLVERLSREDALKDTQWLRWDHKRWILSGGKPDALAYDLQATIDQKWRKDGPFDDVFLVGHSMGGLLVRMAYLRGCGADHASSQSSEWGDKVSRIILFAGLSRGVDSDRRLWLRFIAWFGRFFVPPRFRRLASHLLKGSSTITNLRIQWIRHMAALGPRAPLAVQILGTRDDIVTRDDSVDVEQFPSGCFISIPDAGHKDLHRLDKTSDPDGRYALLRDAFVHRQPVNAVNRTVEGPSKVVFVLHGIRANNKTWVKQTVDHITETWGDVQPIGPEYKYFSALKFAIPTTRRRNLRWFQDAYSEALAKNPMAEFNFIGHSNGTYLFGESLRSIPGMQFERAVLVGSVLPQDYDWDSLYSRKQIKAIRVDGSNKDWPVGWLCNALRGVGMKDVGTAGFEGFTHCNRAQKHDFFWYDGDHSKPLSTENLPALAEYAVEGKLVPPTNLGVEKKWFAVVSRLMPKLAFLLAIVLIAGLIGGLIFSPLKTLIGIAIGLVIVIILDVI